MKTQPPQTTAPTKTQKDLASPGTQAAGKSVRCVCGRKIIVVGLVVSHELPICDDMRELPWPKSVCDQIGMLKLVGG